MLIGSAPPQKLLKQKVQILTVLDILINKYKEQIKGLSIALVTNQTGIDKQGIPNYERLMELDDVHLKIGEWTGLEREQKLINSDGITLS